MDKTQYAVLKKAKLFYGIEEEEIASMLACLSARRQAYKKGQYIYRIGDQITAVALVLNGCVHIQKEDYWGNLFLLSEIAQGELFGEVYAVFHDQLLTRNVLAAKDSTILFLDFRRILTVCTASCPFHTRLIQNFIMLLAEKNQRLTQKLEHISQRTTREKLLSYLSEQSARQGSSSFDIPFNRQQLADFLSVDRSAMSNELSKMRAEGLLHFHKNHFVLF